MKLSEELKWRGFWAENTLSDPTDIDKRENKQFYMGADPSADSLTIGNLAALMMCACFVRHGYKPYMLVGGATGQIGDPKDNGERELKTLEEVEQNKKSIASQMKQIISSNELVMVDNLDWFRDIKYIDFLREIGKQFSMTQLLDRQFVQARIGEGGSGISYAEFSYTLMQGYDYLCLYRKYGVDLQLCGADQYGNCTSGLHLIKRLENAEADVWSTPLILDPVTGRKFGKSEGNAIWLASTDSGSGNYTSIFDFYQFWLNQSDQAVENLLKIYTIYSVEDVENLMKEQSEHPEKRPAQKALATGATEVVHGTEAAAAVQTLSEYLFSGRMAEVLEHPGLADLLPKVTVGMPVVEVLVSSGLVPSKTAARKFIKAGAISVDGTKITDDTATLDKPGILKKGKNKFATIQSE